MAVIGGRAHLNGITFVTNTHVIRGKLSKGTLSINVHRLPGVVIFNLLDKIPFLRGVSKIAKLNLKLFIAFLLFLIIPWDWVYPNLDLGVSELTGFNFVIYGLVFILLIVLLKRLWQFHGAEHKAYNIYLSGADLSLNAVREASRVSDRCGTNLAVIALPILILLSSVTLPVFVLVAAIPIGYEIFNWCSRGNRLKLVFLIASFIQQHIVTAEPTEEQIQLATATLSRAIMCGGDSTIL